MIELPIYSERIILRAIKETDANDIFSYRSLEEIAKYQYWEPFTKEKAISFAKSCDNIETIKKGEWVGLAIISHDMFIGDCFLKLEDHSAEIGCNISPKFQSQGYAKGAIQALLYTAFNIPSIDKVIAITDSENLASIKLMESVGMRKVLDFENEIICKGNKCIELMYSIENLDWIESNK